MLVYQRVVIRVSEGPQIVLNKKLRRLHKDVTMNGKGDRWTPPYPSQFTVGSVGWHQALDKI